MEDIIAQGLARMGLSPAAAPLLAQYGELLLEQNRVMNLTAITQPEQVARLHMLDCAALLLCADFRGKAFLDVGTGAGFPGLVVKILEPSVQLTLLDSQEKRLDWLGRVCARLGLEGVRLVHGRTEELSRQGRLREKFDLAAARAVASMGLLCELCLPYVKTGGRFLAMKSVDSAAEVEAAAPAVERLGGALEPPFQYTIPGSQASHRVILVKKLRPTPPEYPRRWAKMQKSPL